MHAVSWHVVHWAKAMTICEDIWSDSNSLGYAHDCCEHHVAGWPGWTKDFGRCRANGPDVVFVLHPLVCTTQRPPDNHPTYITFCQFNLSLASLPKISARRRVCFPFTSASNALSK